jgi:hypothetical protein
MLLVDAYRTTDLLASRPILKKEMNIDLGLLAAGRIDEAHLSAGP